MHHTERRFLFLIGVVGLVVVTAAIFLLLRREPASDLPKTDAPAVAREVGPPTETRPTAGDEQTRTTIAAAAPSTEVSPLPESYRQALGRIVGRVVNADEQPCPNMHVEAYSVEPMQFLSDLTKTFDDADFTPGLLSGEAITDAEGRFALSGLEPRAVHILGVDLGGPRATARFLDNAPGPGETIDIGDLKLLPSVTFVGRIVDQNQAAVAGARVRATDLPAIVFTSNVQDYRAGDAVLIREGSQELFIFPPNWLAALEKKLPFPTTRTDADGRFRLEGVPVGFITVLVDRAGFVTLQHGPTPSGRSGERDLGTIVISSGTEVTGKVVDAAGNAVGQAEIMGGNRIVLGDVAIMHPSGRADAEGNFSVKALKPAPAYVAARARAGDKWVVQAATPGTAVTVVLPAMSELVIRAEDPTGAAVPNARLQVWLGKDKEAAMLAPALRLSDRIKVDENGVYHVPDVAPGDYIIRVAAAGYGSAQAQGHAGPGALPIVVKLERAVPVTVAVETASSHDPVEHAQVALNHDRGFPLFEPAFETTRTDRSGRATFMRATAGSYDLTVTHPRYGFQTLKVTLPQANLVVQLADGGTVEGHVRKGGEVPAELYLVALMPRGSEINMPRFTATGLDGAFHFRNVGAGNYELSVLERMLNKGPMAILTSLEGGPLKELETTATAGQTTTVEIDLSAPDQIDGPAANLSGHLHMNGSPVAEARVHYWAQRERTVSTDQFGAFDFGRVPAGQGYLRIVQASDDTIFTGQNLWSQQLDLKENEQKVLEVDIATGKLRGRVRHQHDNTPAIQVPVSASRVPEPGDTSNVGGQAHTVTDSNGLFELPVMPRGTYLVSAEEHGYARTRTRVVVEPGVEPAPADIAMLSGVAVAGRIEIAGLDKPPKYIWLRFEPKDGSDTGSDHANVDTAAMTFTAERLAPGPYQAFAYVDGMNFKPADFSVSATGASDVVLRFAVEGQLIKGHVTLPAGSPKPEFLYIHFASKDNKDARGTQVDLETMTFNVQGLHGTYLAHGIAGNRNYEPVEVEIAEGATELTLQFVKEKSDEN
ncbi:MAG: carboxypeptidase-like regulatory domain-containing protein [Planctomycetota bacterium]